MDSSQELETAKYLSHDQLKALNMSATGIPLPESNKKQKAISGFIALYIVGLVMVCGAFMYLNWNRIFQGGSVSPSQASSMIGID